jgi:hypothetical protein
LQAVEQELKLPKTELLLQEQATPRSRPSGDDETRVRAPQHVSPHREPLAKPAQAPERARVATPQAAPDATVRRPPIAVTSEPSSARLDESTASGRRRTRKGVLVAAAILVAAVGAVVVIALVGGSPKTPTADRPTTGERVVPQQIGLSAPPGTPVVSGRRATPTTAAFRWRYANPVADDSFRWQSSGTAAKSTRGTATRRELDVPLRRGATVCLSVQVIRSDGSDPSAFSPPVCVH